MKDCHPGRPTTHSKAPLVLESARSVRYSHTVCDFGFRVQERSCPPIAVGLARPVFSTHSTRLPPSRAIKSRKPRQRILGCRVQGLRFFGVHLFSLRYGGPHTRPEESKQSRVGTREQTLGPERALFAGIRRARSPRISRGLFEIMKFVWGNCTIDLRRINGQASGRGNRKDLLPSSGTDGPQQGTSASGHLLPCGGHNIESPSLNESLNSWTARCLELSTDDHLMRKAGEPMHASEKT